MKKPGINTTIFDLTYVYQEEGERAIVFNSEIRKRFKHKLEGKEKFITEERMYIEMDREGFVFPFNEVLQICEYRKDGYTNNISEIFKKYPRGYYKYFKELLEFDFKGVKFKKRLYVIKHYILFTCMTNNSLDLTTVYNKSNKLLLMMLYLPRENSGR